tara:strand:- start:73 stop:801 length:729 start_codon:yes stop_codon:yes gene_type:complete
LKNKVSIIILAAGKGTRMKSDMPKVLHKVNEKSMIEHVILNARNLNPEKMIVVVGYKYEMVKKQLENQDLTYVIQHKQNGTAHAVMQCEELLKNYDGHTLVLSGDVPLIKSKTLKELFEIQINNKAHATILSAKVKNPYGYGRIIRNSDNNFKTIVEEKDANDSQKNITEINGGIYIFNNQTLFENINKVKNNNNQSEYYLPDVLEILTKQNCKVLVYQINDENEIKGANTEEQLFDLEKNA